MIITCALPYANGSIHLGHLVEHIQADIWVRFQRMQGKKCYFICADDTHGTPVMLKAEQLGISAEEMINTAYTEHVADLTRFNISYDEYYTTHSQESQELVYQIFQKLIDKEKIITKPVEQFYDETKQMFLPDRFVKGTCPKCEALDQYGDSCEVCGATYSPTDLINSYSTISMSKPSLKTSTHYFFKLSDFTDFLEDWINTGDRLQPETKNKMQEWLNSGLQDWDISRDKPYFGFSIPNDPDKYFYVWLDAPVGYMGSLMHYCNNNGLDFYELWNNDNTQIYHFIGKDILYFHALFWPAVLNCADYKTPTSIFAHGFLTINGQKMSKSRGTFITANNYTQSGLSTTFYRYYIASKSSSKIEDIDFSLDDFTAKVNSELIGKFINIAARSAGFLNKFFANRLSSQMPDQSLLNLIIGKQDEISMFYQEREYAKALRCIMQLTDEVNSYVDQNKPWVLAKDAQQLPLLHITCSILINAFRLLSIYLKPIIPELVVKIEEFLKLLPLQWSDINTVILDHEINPYTHLISRVDPAMVNKLIELNNSNTK